MKKIFWNSYSVTKQLGLLLIYLIFTFYIVTATITTPALSAKLLYALGGGAILVGALYYEYLKFLYTKMTTALTMQTDLPQAKKAREKLVKYDIFNGFKGSLIIFDSFIGGLTIKLLEDLKFTKAFVGVNGVNNDNMMAANTEEGQAEALGLNNAQERYVVMDKYKFNRNDFYNFYSLYNVDALLTNSSIAPDTLEHYQTYTKIEN